MLLFSMVSLLRRKMEYQNFVSKIRDIVAEKMGPDFEVFTRRILKYNSVELESLLIKKGEMQVMPSIYLESFYREEENGTGLESVADSIIGLYYQCMDNMEERVNIDFSAEKARKHIIFRLLNYERNRELLKDSIYIRVNDLAAVYYYCTSEEGETISSVRLTEDNLSHFGIERDELYQLAKENTQRMFPYSVKTIKDVMENILEKKLELDGNDAESEVSEIKNLLNSENKMEMYVLTNSKGINGATCLLYDGLLDGIYREMECDFFILPSSIHEVLLIPVKENGDEEDYLKDMVKTVNRTQVSAQEYLSDSVYRYSRDSFKI